MRLSVPITSLVLLVVGVSAIPHPVPASGDAGFSERDPSPETIPGLLDPVKFGKGDFEPAYGESCGPVYGAKSVSSTHKSLIYSLQP